MNALNTLGATIDRLETFAVADDVPVVLAEKIQREVEAAREALQRVDTLIKASRVIAERHHSGNGQYPEEVDFNSALHGVIKSIRKAAA